jgi:prepilin peptidase CpaA
MPPSFHLGVTGTREDMPLSIVASTVVFTAICIALDVRSRRIPNAVTGPAIVLGVALNLLHGGVQGLGCALAGLLIMIVILLGPFALGGIGGGDVKMMAALGSLIGPRLASLGLAFGMILGGAIMVLHLGRLGRLGQKLRATASMFSTAAATGSLAPLRISTDQPDAIALPYSVPLGLGTLAVLLLGLATGGTP